jgi:hypothetical protein
VFTHTFHNSCSFDIKGCKYTSIAIPGELGLEIIKDKMKFGCFMYNIGGKLYGITMTGQVLWIELMLPNGLNPSNISPSLTLRGSDAKSRCFSSNDFHASPSAECLNTPSFVRPSACHLIFAAVCCDINNLCKRGISGNHRNTLMGCLLDGRDYPSLISSFHFDNPYFVQKSKCSLSFQNNV